MWTIWSHLLLPLTRLTFIKRKFKWTQAEKYDFEKIRRIVVRELL